jgi:hypothetical protein
VATFVSALVCSTAEDLTQRYVDLG